jgi:hypothetical protein
MATICGNNMVYHSHSCQPWTLVPFTAVHLVYSLINSTVHPLNTHIWTSVETGKLRKFMYIFTSIVHLHSTIIILLFEWRNYKNKRKLSQYLFCWFLHQPNPHNLPTHQWNYFQILFPIRRIIRMRMPLCAVSLILGKVWARMSTDFRRHGIPPRFFTWIRPSELR